MLIPEDLDEIAVKKIGLVDGANHTDFGKGLGEPRRKLTAASNFKQLDALEVRIVPKDGDFDYSVRNFGTAPIEWIVLSPLSYGWPLPKVGTII